VPLQWLGLSFLIPAGIAFFGLASGWARPLVIGHLLIGTTYLVLGITYLRQSKVDSLPLAAGGSLLLLLSAFLLATTFRKIPDAVALSTGMAAMLVGRLAGRQGTRLRLPDRQRLPGRRGHALRVRLRHPGDGAPRACSSSGGRGRPGSL
jgi:hypothetical protein